MLLNIYRVATVCYPLAVNPLCVIENCITSSLQHLWNEKCNEWMNEWIMNLLTLQGMGRRLINICTPFRNLKHSIHAEKNQGTNDMCCLRRSQQRHNRSVTDFQNHLIWMKILYVKCYCINSAISQSSWKKSSCWNIPIAKPTPYSKTTTTRTTTIHNPFSMLVNSVCFSRA